MIHFGLLRERKSPPDTRVALSPVQCVSVQKRFPQVKIWVESSAHRTFSDQEYREAGIPVVDNLGHCDVLFGIKEVPAAELIPGKTYFFFSHTIKQQAKNRGMMQAICRNKITLIDYETLKWESGTRVLGFGRWAGIVGAYNGFLSWGLKSNAYTLKPAWQCRDYAEVLRECLKIVSGPMKIVLTGGGRVANGALEFLRQLDLKEVTPEDFLLKNFDRPVFVHLNSHELYRHKQGKPWDSRHFYQNHHDYESSFRSFLPACDLLINGIFWTEDLPRLFEKGDTAWPGFRIRVIADISCDVEGSVPITLRATSIPEPLLGWNKVTQQEDDPMAADSIAVMAVDNLPNELPKDASEEFGENLFHYVIPEILAESSAMLAGARITRDGKVTDVYAYMRNYAAETE
jgi:saccharopine dehydrogenase (NAD+, L-lysine forming)